MRAHNSPNVVVINALTVTLRMCRESRDSATSTDLCRVSAERAASVDNALKAQTHLPATPTLDVQTGLSRVQATHCGHLYCLLYCRARGLSVACARVRVLYIPPGCTSIVSMPMPGLYKISFPLSP